MKAQIKKLVPKKIIHIWLGVISFFAIKVYKLKYPHLVIRKRTTDSEVFRSIFVFHEFKLPIKIDPQLIVDAGAYTGLSALYYSSQYPHAKIICIEPETSNFEILEKNTKHLPNISRVQAGLWNKNTFLKIQKCIVEKWAFTVEEVWEGEDFDMKSVTIDTILRESWFWSIDILKLDIEGAEKQLFSTDTKPWLDRVNIIVIELHDRFIDGCSQSLYSAIHRSEWKEFREGEKVILIRNEYYASRVHE